MNKSNFLAAAVLTFFLAPGLLLAEGDSATGKTLSIDCADCHGENGLGDEDVPAIAGMDETKHVEALMGYKSGEIPDEDEEMLPYVEELSEQDMADLAAYYATLEGPDSE